MAKDRVTVKDVAREAGVAAQTVSRVFRNQGYLSEETKRRVRAAAQKLNYVPNHAAISLRVGSKKTIAVVFDGLRNVYFSVMIDYLYREADRLGYSLLTVFRAYDHEITEEVYRDVLSLGAAAVVSFLEPSPEMREATRRYGVPVLVLGRRTDLDGLNYVTTDDEKGGRLAAERLMRCGCRRFLFLAEGMRMTCVRDRLKGFSEALAARGYEIKVLDAGGGIAEGLQTLAAEGFSPDGVFCFSDMLAYSLLLLLGGGVRVVGYDDVGAEIPFPMRLTSVGTDKEAYVRFALGKLIDKIESGDGSPIRAVYDVFLHEGETA